MCGIAGSVSGTGDSQAQALAAGRRMAQALAHRGPDDEKFWQDHEAGITFVFRRLAIQDLTDGGAQPMSSASGRYTIVFNGEIYNFLEIRSELQLLKVNFRGRSDTEVMLAACEQWGVNAALQKFNGMFAFALWDKKERRIHLVRDRVGKKPLYAGWIGRQLVFASELKAFHAHGQFSAEIDRDVLSLYMRYAYVPAPCSIYKGVWQILPGCRLTIDVDRMNPGSDLSSHMEPYWHLPQIVEDARSRIIHKSENDIIGDFEDLLRGCVRERMVSDVPLGAFLSGGVDSSTIVALMQQISERPVKTYTIGFAEQGYDEAKNAAAVAHHLGTDHHEHYMSAKDVLDVIPSLPDIFDEPFADASQIPTYLVSKFARKDVTVALSGDGGDETMGGYLRHFMTPHLWAKVGWMPRGLRTRIGAAIRKWPQEHWDNVAPHMPQFGRRLYKFSELMAAQNRHDVYGAQVEHWRNSIVPGAERMPSIPLTDPSWWPKDLNLTERMIYLDTLSYLPNDLMVKADRASMAASLEMRAPLLDRRVIEYAWRLPLRMKVRSEGKSITGKWLLRQVLARHMPADLFERPKQGFSVPVEQWLRGPLKDWAESLLDERRLREDGMLDAGAVRTTWNAYLAGQHQHATRIWTVLMFQAWQDRWQKQAVVKNRGTG